MSGPKAAGVPARGPSVSATSPPRRDWIATHGRHRRRIERMRACLGVVLAAGCYQPKAPDTCTVRCDFAASGSCPSGLMCLADNLCHDPATPTCAPPEADAAPIPPDVRMIDANYVFV